MLYCVTYFFRGPRREEWVVSMDTDNFLGRGIARARNLTKCKAIKYMKYMTSRNGSLEYRVEPTR